MILRYPGGKKKAADRLVKLLLPSEEPIEEFREPYCGSAAVALTLLKEPRFHGKIWLNDLDPGISSLWTTVLQDPDGLQNRIKLFEPSVAAFREFKESLLNEEQSASLTTLERGFRKLVMHQTSFSGLGTRAGSPIGGWDQTGKYKIGCRWHSVNISNKVGQLHLLMKGRCLHDCCTQLDALQVIEAPGKAVTLYVDPPYVLQGSSLYQYGYDSQEPHRQLASALKRVPYRWVLSYDEDPLVRELYSGHNILEASWAYSINSQKDNPGKELIILSPGIVSQQEEERSSFKELFGF